MEEAQHQPVRPSFPPGGEPKWMLNASGGNASGNSFGQDSGYSSYQSTTPNTTFSLSFRHGASVTLATIDEAQEGADSSMNDSGSGSSLGAVCSNILTPKTAASIDQISNFHLTSPDGSSGRPKRASTRRRCDFDVIGAGGASRLKDLFVAPGTPERLPRSGSFDSNTPQSTVNRSSHQSQLTPHKAKGGIHSAKRKRSIFREKLRSEGDAMQADDNESAGASAGAAGDENRANDLNDSIECKPLDISPIPNVKRRKPNENITNLIRCSTPKTASSQPHFVMESTENLPMKTAAAPVGRDRLVTTGRTAFRKFQSFSPSKLQQSSRPKVSSYWRKENQTDGDRRQLQRTPQKRNPYGDGDGGGSVAGYVTPSKEQGVLAEIHTARPPTNLDGLLSGAILDVPVPCPLLSVDEQLELESITTVATLEDFSMTPSKANLADPEQLLSTTDVFSLRASQDSVAPGMADFRFTTQKLHEAASPPTSSMVRFETGRLPRKPTALWRYKLSARKSKRTNRVNRRTSCKSSSPAPKNQLHVLKRLFLEHNEDTLYVLLDYLTDEDLVQVVQVSKGWKELLRKFPKQWQRLQKHLELQEDNKENRYPRTSTTSDTNLLKGAKAGEPSSVASSRHQTTTATTVVTSDKITPPVAKDIPESKRQPFRVRNLQNTSNIRNCSVDSSSSALFYASFGSDCGSVTTLPPELGRRRSSAATVLHSPPVSPSKIKFVTNQKVASRLKESEQLRQCPRCGRPSRVIFARSSKNGQSKTRASAVAARLGKSYTLPDSDAGNDDHYGTITKATASRNNNDYSTTTTACSGSNNSSHQQRPYVKGSPDSARKQLFGSCSGSSSGSKPPAVPALGAVASRRNSAPHLRDTARNGSRMQLCHGTKSVDQSCRKDSATGRVSPATTIRDAMNDYAICSSKNCGFQFCIKCLCDNHPDTVCLDLAPNSPSKDEERGRPNVPCSRKSRQDLMRLCRHP